MAAGFAYVVEWVVKAWATIIGGAGTVWTWIKSIATAIQDMFPGPAGLVKDFIDGLVNGITGGVSRVVDAAKNLGKSALDSVKSALGIHSPSTEMAMLGGHTATGFAQGIEGSSDVAQASMSAMVAPPTPSTTAGAAAGASAGGKSVSVQVESGAVVVTVGGGAGGAAGASPQALQALLQQALQDALEKLANEVAGQVAA
jgi:hypothetical protein